MRRVEWQRENEGRWHLQVSGGITAAVKRLRNEWYLEVCGISQPPFYRYHAPGVAMAKATALLREHLQLALDKLPRV